MGKKQKLTSDETRILANSLQDYAHKLLTIHAVADYNNQLTKWKRFINGMADAQQAALAAHKKVMDDMAANDAFAMMALAMICGPTFSWIAGTIELSLYPKFAKMCAQRFTKPPHPANHNAVRAKVFGDTAGALAHLGADRLFALPKIPTERKVNLGAAAEGTVLSFKTTLENALLEEGALRTNAIQGLGMTVLKDAYYGTDVLARLYRLLPGTEYDPYLTQQAGARSLIRSGIDDTRKGWAKEWFYFGNDPVTESPDSLSRKMEKEIWALWILKQKYKLTERIGLFGIPVPGPVMGKDTDLRWEVVERLVDLDIVLAQERRVGVSWPITDGVVVESTTKQVKQQLARRKSDPSMQIPVLRDGEFDTKEEVQMLNDWAKYHQPELVGGHQPAVPRTIPPIEDVHNVN